MTVFTEGRHAGEYLIWEADPSYSRETGTVASGENLAAGTVLKDDGTGKLVAATGDLATDGSLQEAAVGVLYDNVDATAGDIAGAVYTARSSTVELAALTYPAETTSGGEQAAIIASLLAAGIRTR